MEHPTQDRIGRPVREVSISFAIGKTLAEICDVFDREGAQGGDLIALPETWLREDLRHYLDRGRQQIDAMRGWPFAGRALEDR